MVDLSLARLFPEMPQASEDPKCCVIAKAMQQMARFTDLSVYTAEEIQADAAKRYAFLCEERRISPLEASAIFLFLYNRGVFASTAEEYIAFRRMMPKTGVEPATFALRMHCSTN